MLVRNRHIKHGFSKIWFGKFCQNNKAKADMFQKYPPGSFKFTRLFIWVSLGADQLMYFLVAWPENEETQRNFEFSWTFRNIRDFVCGDSDSAHRLAPVEYSSWQNSSTLYNFQICTIDNHSCSRNVLNLGCFTPHPLPWSTGLQRLIGKDLPEY